MKNLIALALALISLQAFSQNNPVVIELFTSQGCSSCPAADKNLAEIIESSAKNGQAVYGLSFHVDYWNYIGWKDPYSKAEFTERQRHYAQVMNSNNIYTPQMIVNGETEFVGSNKNASSQALTDALAKKMQRQISLTSIQPKDGKIIISYSLNEKPNSEILNAAIVERMVANDVTRGENAGRKLTHKNVVRTFVSLPAQKEGVIKIDLPSGISPSSIIVFTQDQQWRVTGATAKNIEQ